MAFERHCVSVPKWIGGRGAFKGLGRDRRTTSRTLGARFDTAPVDHPHVATGLTHDSVIFDDLN